MTVTNTSYTTNSYKVSISNELSSTNIITGVDTAIVALGWTQYDVIAPSGSDPTSTYVYRVLCADATNFKYFIIKWDPLQMRFWTSICESWNTTTNVATNECWTNSGGFYQGYDIKNGFIFVSGTARHLVIWPFIKNEPGMWAGVFEFERVAPEDTTVGAFPCYAWTNSLMIGTPWGKAATGTVSTTMYAFCRTPDGSTGAAAAAAYAPVTSRGMFPPSFPSGSITIATDTNLLHLGSHYNIPYGWDVAKTLLSPISVDGVAKSMVFGRTYNLGASKPMGNSLDTVFTNIDSTGGWPSATGSSTECILLPMNGGFEGDSAYNANQLAASYGASPASGSVNFSKCISIGDTMWISSSDGIRTWNMDGGNATSTTLVYSNASGVTDIIFDGERTIYGAISTGIVRIDTETLANTVLTTNVTGGGAYLAIDYAYVYMTSRTAATAPQCYVISRWNPGGATGFAQVATFTLATTLIVVASTFGVPVPDYTGKCYVATTAGTTGTTQTMRIASFTASTGAQLFNVANPLRPTAGASMAESPTSFYIDELTGRIYLFVCNTTNGTIYELNTSLVAIQTVGSITTAATGAPLFSNLLLAAGPDHRGDLNMLSIRGIFNASPKKVGIATVTSGWNARFLLNSPMAATPGTIQFLATTASLALPATPLGYAGQITHNGCRTLASFCQTLVSDNRAYYLSNYYNVTNIKGTGTGRLTLKG
jgi:hypothetical protein